jgi:hypothetical protein
VPDRLQSDERTFIVLVPANRLTNWCIGMRKDAFEASLEGKRRICHPALQ